MLWLAFFFFKQKPAYEMRISDWSSDVCSSDLIARAEELGYDNVWLTEHHFTEDGYNPALMATAAAIAARTSRIRIGSFILLLPFLHPVRAAEEIGRASFRERVCQSV